MSDTQREDGVQRQGRSPIAPHELREAKLRNDVINDAVRGLWTDVQRYERSVAGMVPAWWARAYEQGLDPLEALRAEMLMVLASGRQEIETILTRMEDIVAGRIAGGQASDEENEHA